jgi:hypothetical protein
MRSVSQSVIESVGLYLLIHQQDFGSECRQETRDQRFATLKRDRHL